MTKSRFICTRAALPLMMALAFAACGGDREKSARGFRLPDGDIDKGKEAFTALSCHRCHAVSGLKLPEYAGESPLNMTLGGEVYKVKNYGQLVTSIINPDHVVSKDYLKQIPKEERASAKEDSPMPAANDKMTVAQLIDLVTFLQSRYELLQPDYELEYGPSKWR